MKRKLFCLILALCLCLSAAALGETTVYSFETSDLSLNRTNGCMAVRDGDTRLYSLMSPEGEILTSEAYTYMSSTYYGLFKTEAYSEDGLHRHGVIDGTGRTLVPPVYADTEIVSARWQIGITLTPCGADDQDYTVSNWSTGEKEFYRIDTADLFLDGQKVGTLSRSDFANGYSSAYGAYICVQNRERQRIFYDGAMNAQESEYSGEYYTYYKNKKTNYIHNGTGQLAFTPGCTLTADEVDQSLMLDGSVLLDLQGNELGHVRQNYDSTSRLGNGFWRVKVFGKYGVVDSILEEIIPCEYDDISISSGALSYGYIGAVKDGRFGYVDMYGNVTCDFVYGADNASDKGTFATVKDLDGSIIVLSAAVGELPEHYADAYFAGYDGCMAFVATNAAGEKGLVGLNGKTIIPFSEDIRDIYVTYDGLTAAVSLGSHVYEIYNIDPADYAVDESAVKPVQPDTWTCENGHEGNTGNFCSECGAPRG